MKPVITILCALLAACLDSTIEVSFGPVAEHHTQWTALTQSSTHDLEVVDVTANARGTTVTVAVEPALCEANAIVLATAPGHDSEPLAFLLDRDRCDGVGSTEQAATLSHSTSTCYCDIYGTRRCQTCVFSACTWQKTGCCSGYASCPG